MRVVILSDIHSNFVALEAVLAAAGSYDELWNLGDTIGYGPRPNECMAAMRERASVMIAGNHDLACLGLVDLSDFNPEARAANIWNGAQLHDGHREALESLPPLHPVNARFMVAHGSPRDAVWEYLLTRAQAQENFKRFEQQVCFVGHSHVPLCFKRPEGERVAGPHLPDDGEQLELRDGTRYIINPGSVGQPRNQDPRAAFAILDTDTSTVTFRRVEYDIVRTQQEMRAAQLPEPLAARLQYGM
jgi:diadenosine tetraphosphatase ApaH/serine/threonine PP2A family protein phosphatase